MQNKSFKFALENPHLNAVVGGRWAGDSDHAYVTGFGQAVEVLLAAAVKQAYFDPTTDEPKGVYVDALVYPICFCARHHVELFLKRQIRAVSALKTGIPSKVDATHDLRALWAEFKQHVVIDVRLQELADPLDEFVSDIAAIDINGETFRYAEDKNGAQHLQSTEHINLYVLAGRLGKMMEVMESFDTAVEDAEIEYAQKTTTDELSREQIRQVAKRLPVYETWADGTLEPIKKAVMDELGLTSNAFGRVLNIIKAHRGFAPMIGIELPLTGLQPDVFGRLKKIAVGQQELTALSDDEWTCLEAVLEIGYPYVFCEQYESLVERYSEDEKTKFDRDHIKRSVIASRRFRIGLSKLGQRSLLNAFNASFPEEPALPAMTLEELQESFRKAMDSARKKNAAKD